MTEILHKYSNAEDGIETHVTKHHKGGFGVTVFDVDSGNYARSVKILPSEVRACEVAKSIAEGKGKGELML